MYSLVSPSLGHQHTAAKGVRYMTKTYQKWTQPSAPPETKVRPSLEYFKAVTERVCDVRVWLGMYGVRDGPACAFSVVVAMGCIAIAG